MKGLLARWRKLSPFLRGVLAAFLAAAVLGSLTGALLHGLGKWVEISDSISYQAGTAVWIVAVVVGVLVALRARR